MSWANGEILREQLRSVNFVYIVDRTVDLYCCRWWGYGRSDWSHVPAFSNRSLEHRLAEVRFRFPGSARKESANIYLVRGHLFEIKLSFVPQGLLGVKNLDVESVQLSNAYNDAILPDEQPPEQLTELPECITNLLPVELTARVLTAFQPKPSDVIAARLQEIFGSYPPWLQEILSCTDGFCIDTGTFGGLRDMHLVPLGAGDFCMIGEFERQGERGALGFYSGDATGKLWWINYSGVGHVCLGDNIKDALSGILAPPERM